MGARDETRRVATGLAQRRRTGRRWIAATARRHAATGPGRRAVVTFGHGRCGGRRRQGDRRRDCRRRAGGFRRATVLMRYLFTHLDTAWALTLIHLRLSMVPVLFGLLIAVPLGAFVQRTRILRRVTTVTASIIFTIPSLALFVVLPLIIPTRILDEANVIVALTLYTTALLVRAVPEALDAVPGQVRDAATAVGYRPLTRMLKVDLPLSIPVLVASLRVIAVTNISMVSVGSVIGIGG